MPDRAFDPQIAAAAVSHSLRMIDRAFWVVTRRRVLGNMVNMHDRAPEPSSWGAYVRLRRTELGLRQDELAALAGVSTRFVHTLEQSKPSLRLDKVLAVFKQLGLDLALEPGTGTIRTTGTDPH